MTHSTTFWQIIKATDKGYEQVWQSENYPYPGIVALVAADSDEDGAVEIYVAPGDGTIRVFDGLTLEQTTTLNVEVPFDAMAVADLDGDGIWEIVVARAGFGLDVYSVDTGELKWSNATGGGRTLAIGNVDNDLALEIVTSVYSGPGFVVDGITGEVEWNNPDGFGSLIKLGDLDDDGRMEIVGAAPWYKITIFDAELKAGSWEITTIHDVGEMLLTDVDGDGDLEVIYGDGNRGKIHCVDATSRAERWSVDNPESGVSGLAVDDFDRDGRIELWWGTVSADAGSNLFVADLATGEIEWQDIVLSGALNAMDVGDVDDDGRDEIVMVTRGSGEGLIFDAQTHALEWRGKLDVRDGMGVRSVRIGDVDDDGRAEFVVSTDYLYDGFLQVYDGTSHRLKRQTAGYIGTYFSALKIGDLDGDGRLEIVAGQGTGSGADGIFLIAFDGATMAEKWRSEDMSGYSSNEIYDIELADVDRDGRIEIIASLLGSRVIVYDGLTHELQELFEYPAYAVAITDFDGDGNRDILVGRDDGDIGVFEGSSFTPKETVFAFGKHPISALQVIDLDGDGMSEWLVASFGQLRVIDGDTRVLRWTSQNLSENLGGNNQLYIRDTDGDGAKEIFLGANIAVFQYE